MGSRARDRETRHEAGQTLSRRTFFSLAAAAVAATALASERDAPEPAAKSLSFAHLHTGEHLAITYCDAGCYLPSALEQVDHFLRDFRTGEVGRIDPLLLDILHEVKRATGARTAFSVISGFRSRSTNAMLVERTSGVSSHSLHMVGKAIDVRLEDVATTRLRDAALRLGRGGVGYYHESDFVHLDTGRVRRW
jgi:uncharacterized protein YcbK (DUF882 family)